MNITECRVVLTDDTRNDRGPLLGYAAMVIDDAFLVRDIKIIRGDGGPFISMPSRQIKDRCSDCGAKNHLTAAYCSRCGFELDPHRATRGKIGQTQLHADICHPINEDCRRLIHDAVMAAYRRKVETTRIT